MFMKTTYCGLLITALIRFKYKSTKFFCLYLKNFGPIKWFLTVDRLFSLITVQIKSVIAEYSFSRIISGKYDPMTASDCKWPYKQFSVFNCSWRHSSMPSAFIVYSRPRFYIVRDSILAYSLQDRRLNHLPIIFTRKKILK